MPDKKYTEEELKQRKKQMKLDQQRSEVEEWESKQSDEWKAYEQRMQRQKQVYANKGKAPEVGGALGNAMNQANLSAEGAAYNLFWVMLFNALAFMTNLKFREQEADYNYAKDLGIAYEPGTPIYKLNAKGEPDFKQPANEDEIDSAMIRGNGYVPLPSQQEAFLSQWDEYTADMFGSQYLSSEQRERLYKTRDSMEEEMKGRDLKKRSRDQYAYGAMQKKPVQKPK